MLHVYQLLATMTKLVISFSLNIMRIVYKSNYLTQQTESVPNS